MKTKKAEKTDVKTVEFRVWCSSCSIRIAPHEERIAVGGQVYHPRCHSKTVFAVSNAASGSKVQR